ncbi:MAG: hypothetical protein DSM106950_23990 [Stigonema ocellatum SAG 48.90 = DSM 106950]|nr:hypothetical protein [Stigonema ocellatum SAG 48.90 = DSM 106950]
MFYFLLDSSAITLTHHMGYTTQIIDYQTQSTDTLQGNHLVLLPIFNRGNPFRGSARLTQAAENLLKKLLIK